MDQFRPFRITAIRLLSADNADAGLVQYRTRSADAGSEVGFAARHTETGEMR